MPERKQEPPVLRAVRAGEIVDDRDEDDSVPQLRRARFRALVVGVLIGAALALLWAWHEWRVAVEHRPHIEKGR